MDGPIVMATLLRAFLILLPPVSVVLLAVAARNLSALARAQLPCLPAGSSSSSFPFRPLSSSSERKRAVISEEVLRVAPYSRRSCRRRRPISCDGGKDEDESVEECVVCLSVIEEGEEIRELKCRHVFHRSCLDRWLLARPAVAATCPLCRCRLLTRPPAEEACYEEEAEPDEEEDNMMLFMACVHGRSSWFWRS